MIITGDCLVVLKTLDTNSVDSIVTDPPYHLTDGSKGSKGFMGQQWDGGDIAFRPDVWQECLRVLKPGGHLIAFSGSRTYHRMATAIEDAGFTIRDQLMWVYGSGFPKSHDIGKAVDKALGNKRVVVEERPQTGAKFKLTQELIDNGGFNDPTRQSFAITQGSSEWEGWGTALKPAHEPMVLARKPLSERTIAANVIKWGTGAINIDVSRVPLPDDDALQLGITGRDSHALDTGDAETEWGFKAVNREAGLGRFPANFIHDGIDEHWSHYFYCPKVSRKERNLGCEDLPAEQFSHDGRQKSIENAYQRNNSVSSNNHPTVKPIALMEYLVKLVTPVGGVVLDPFTGSGSTGIAAVGAGYRFLGIELSEEYAHIARLRVQHASVTGNRS